MLLQVYDGSEPEHDVTIWPFTTHRPTSAPLGWLTVRQAR